MLNKSIKAATPVIKNIRCWWFGCKPDPLDYAPVEELECSRCGSIMNYESLVGLTRRDRFKDWCSYWFFRKWMPKKCECCGGRWSHDESVDHIPF